MYYLKVVEHKCKEKCPDNGRIKNPVKQNNQKNTHICKTELYVKSYIKQKHYFPLLIYFVGHRLNIKMNVVTGSGKWSECGSAWNVYSLKWPVEGDSNGF